MASRNIPSRITIENLIGKLKETFARQSDVTALTGRVQTAESKITTLVGADTGKSARTIANEELAAQLIPASAKESLDTLAEIASWIQSHPDDAAAMNTAISGLASRITTLEGKATQVTASGTNGHITVDGADLTVYTLPTTILDESDLSDYTVAEIAALLDGD